MERTKGRKQRRIISAADAQKAFQMQAALAVHQQRKHNQRVALRRVIVDGVCRACGRCYHTPCADGRHRMLVLSSFAEILPHDGGANGSTG